jgi:hypothetical protein
VNGCKIAQPIASSGVSYHSRPNGSASEIRSTPRLSFRRTALRVLPLSFLSMKAFKEEL